MASAKTLSFENAIEYMDPMQVTDCLQKTLDFLQRNNTELYFPSISPYVEAFLVNLVSDTRNLRSKSFKYEDKKFASEIIQVLEISKDVFRWTHSYEHGNLLVYKKIFSNMIKLIPAKPSSIAHRLLHAQTQQSTPNVHHDSPQQAPNIGHAPESTKNPPDPPITSTGFKLRFLNKTLAFIKNDTVFTLFNEMPLSQAEYVYSLIKNQDKDVGFGYKSLYAPLWEAMEEYSVDYEFEVTLKEASSRDTAVLMLEKVPKTNKSKKDKATKKVDIPESKNNTNGPTQKEGVTKNTRTKLKQDSNNQAHEQSFSIAHRLLHAQTQQSTPNVHHASPQQAPNIDHVPEFTKNPPDPPITSTGFKLRFLNKTLAFIKNETEFTLFNEMPLAQAEYVYSLIKNWDKDVGFGYNSLYAPLWEAMEEYSVDYEFEVTLKEASSRDTAVLMLEKVPKTNKSKKNKATKKVDIPESKNNTNGPTQKEGVTKNTRTKLKQGSNNQAHEQSLNIMSPAFPPLELLSNISERFFTKAVVALTDFADDETRASVALHQLADEEIAFVKRVKTLAESSNVREMFSPQHRDLLWRLDYSIKQVMETCKITTTVNEKDRSITLKKTPRFATPLPVSAVTQQSFATSGARSKSLASAKTRGRSISKDRLIRFQKGGTLPDTGSVESSADVATKESQQKRGRSRDGMCNRKAKLLEDLSTPLESDRGIRMMQLMGWNGGALGARGNGIMEPVMPAIDLPSRGGLGHVPPPKPAKATQRRPLDFRLTFLQSIYDLLLHGESQKEIQLKDPLLQKERKYIQSALGSLNKGHSLVLTKKENELVALVAGELAGRPGLEVRPEYSKDLRTVTLIKLTNHPARTPTQSDPRPRPVKSSDVTTIKDDDADVLITDYEVMSILPHVDVSGMKVPADRKAVRRRAIRLVFLVKLAEALNWDYQPRIVFKFDFPLAEKIKTFVRRIVESLNRGDWPCNLLGCETEVYEDLRDIAWGEQLELEILPGSKFVFTRTIIISEDSLANAGTKPRDNNNDDKTDNRNQIAIVNECTKQMDVDNDNSKKENNVVENNVASQRLIEAIVKYTSNLKDAISNVDLKNKDDHLSLKSNDDGLKGIEVQGNSNTGDIADDIKNNITEDVSVKAVNLIKIEVDNHIPTEIENTEGVEVKMETECDISEPDVENEGVVNNKVTEAKIKVRDISELSDWDRNIQDLEMSILNADLNFVLKEENDTECDLEMAIPETDLNLNMKKEIDIDYLNTKRPHSSSVCSQELDLKRFKICAETDEYVVIITPQIKDEKMTEELVKQIQTLMANELDKAGGFLPLLKCHGVQYGGLIYSCHDEDDVAWLKNVASAANVDVEPVLHDVCLEKKSRDLLIRINSYVPLDAKKIVRKFEIYNVGLDTKYWKITHKHTGTTFIMFIVTVDEKSFKYICDENFSLYCGIDKAQFSIIL